MIFGFSRLSGRVEKNFFLMCQNFDKFTGSAPLKRAYVIKFMYLSLLELQFLDLAATIS
jgi:hypothetical protein